MHLDRIAGQPDDKVVWGSDVAAQMLRRFGIPYVSLNPGASYRGLHDSLVNHLGNERPGMLLCLHEDHAVAIAHGYAKATGEPMACVLHSNVGLMHGMMSLYNAWCDRVPMIVLGATGPLDSAKRRPWIDWIHTSRDQGALIRSFVKWDDLPASPDALVEAMCRANILTRTAPTGPVYICLDAGLQESKLEKEPEWPDLARFTPPAAARPARGAVEKAAALLSNAQRPLLLIGRGQRTSEAWQARIRLAERLGACVMTDLKSGAAFPTDHPAHVVAPINFAGPAAREVICTADVILALDWVDLAGALRQAKTAGPVAAKIISSTLDQNLHNGFNMDHQGLPPVDLYLLCETDAAVPLLLEATDARSAGAALMEAPPLPPLPDAVSLRGVAAALEVATRGIDVCYTRFPLGWNGAYTHFRHPLDYIGHDGGAGVGSGPGMTVGAGLALKGSGRIPIGLLGDGDFLMGNTAIWTAAHYQIPCLMIVCNNRSFYNDERHQGRMAVHRGRPEENRWIGLQIGDPDIDIAGMARTQGALGIGPVAQLAELRPAIERGIEAVRSGQVCVIDARVLPGYDREP